MTTVKFYFENNNLSGFEISGHSTAFEKDVEGKIVCSAISSAAYMAANSCIEIVGASVKAKVEDGLMFIKLNNKVEESQVVMKGLMLHINELAKQYPKRITVISEV